MGEKSGTAKKKTAATRSAAKQKAAKVKAKSPAKAKAAKKTATRKTTPKTDAAAAKRDVPEGSVAVVNADNKRVSDLVLHPEVFGVVVNEHLLYEAVKQYRANARAGTHATKNRALVSGSGKKPWRQKGTGRARVGEIRTPLWRHGGTVFGPQPRDYSYAMPKKARAAGHMGAERITQKNLEVVRVDADNNILVVKGSVPGGGGGYLVIRKG